MCVCVHFYGCLRVCVGWKSRKRRKEEGEGEEEGGREGASNILGSSVYGSTFSCTHAAEKVPSYP